MSRSLAALTEDLFAHVARQCPQAMEAIAAECAGLTVSVRVGESYFGVAASAQGAVMRAPTRAVVRVEASAAALREVMTGEREVLDALREERVRVFGAATDFVKLDAMVRLLVAGAARAPDAGALLDEFIALSNE